MVGAEEADAADIEAQFATLEKEALDRLTHEGVALKDIVLQRVDRHDVSRPVALARGQCAAPDRCDPRPHRKLPYRAQARIQFPPRQRPGQLLPPQPESGRHRPQGRIGRACSLPELFPIRSTDAGSGSRAQRFDTPVYQRDHLPCGFAFQGPALVEQVDATTVVPPGASAEVDKYLNIIIRVKE